METEEWKPVNVIDYGTNYEISNFGNIRNIKTNKILKLNGKNDRGYKYVDMCYKGKYKSFQIHRLMGLTFLPNPHNKPQIDHIDRNPSNNLLSNLRWVTGAENQANRGKPIHNTSGELHINILYKFQVTRHGKIIQKCFKTMEEALEFRKQELGF